MRIYYFGELIEENGRKVRPEQTETLEQTALDLDNVRPVQTRSADMQSIGEIIKELDLTLDSFRPIRLQSTGM